MFKKQFDPGPFNYFLKKTNGVPLFGHYNEYRHLGFQLVGWVDERKPSERRVGRSEAETHPFQINVIVFLIGGMVVVGALSSTHPT